MTKTTDSKASYTVLRSDAAPVVVDAVVVPVTDRVEVVAPATLPGGYELHVDFQGHPAVVRVPNGGVEKGQTFVGEVIRYPPTGGGASSSEGHRIPTGQWRDGCCDCFKHGLCHPMLCLACWCPPLALGQVMTRMKLTGTGKATIPQEGRTMYWSAFKVLALVFIVYIAVEEVISTLLNPYAAQMQYTMDENGNFIEPDFANIPTWVWVVSGLNSGIKVLFWVYMFVLLIRTRAYVRNRYNIPEQRCRGCEDCCCAFWVPCCTTLQIARHTADYETYHAACCTETGLPPHAPEVV